LMSLPELERTVREIDDEHWIGKYGCTDSLDLGKVLAVEEPCEFHRQQAIDLKLKRCVKCKENLRKYHVPIRRCYRCCSRDKLEEDHIVPRSRGGSESQDNKRWACRACHDFRHAKDNVLEEIKKFTDRNPAQLTMWLFRLGVLEWFNRPEEIRVHGYRSYFDLPETHYERWYEYIKLADKGRNVLEKMGLMKGPEQVKLA